MRKTIIPLATIILLAIFLPIKSFARIGETYEQCIARYGKVVEIEGEFFEFEKDGFKIGIRFNQKDDLKSAWAKDLVIKKSNRESIAIGEVMVFLDSNSNGKIWKKPQDVYKGNLEWETTDGAITAMRFESGSHLIIGAKTKFAIEKAKEQAEKTMKGF